MKHDSALTDEKLKELLSVVSSTAQSKRISQFIGTDYKRFQTLFEIFISEDNRLAQKASAVINHCIKREPKFLDQKYQDLLYLLDNPPHKTVMRNVLRMLQYVNIPQKWQGYFYNKCMALASNTRESIAVRVFSMQVIANIASGIPELESEIRALLVDHAQSDSPGIRARCRNILKSLDKNRIQK